MIARGWILTMRCGGGGGGGDDDDDEDDCAAEMPPPSPPSGGGAVDGGGGGRGGEDSMSMLVKLCFVCGEQKNGVRARAHTTKQHHVKSRGCTWLHVIYSRMVRCACEHK